MLFLKCSGRLLVKMTLSTGFYIVKGHFSQSYTVSEGQEIKKLPTQADMINNGRQWLRPGNLADVVRPASLVDSISGRRFRYGGYIIEWPLQNLSPNMVGYLQSEFFDGRWYADVTIQTFNRANGKWEGYQATAKWPDYINEAEIMGGGFNNFKLTFVNAEIAPVGPNLVTAGDVDGNFVLNGTGTYIVTISNVGDDSTFNPITVNADIPSGVEFSSESSGANWSASYSTDGVTYTSLLPSDPSTIIAVRWESTATIESQSSAPDIEMTVRFASPGNTTTSFTISMQGDVDETDNTITFTSDIPFFPDNTGFGSGFEYVAFGRSPTGFSEGFSFGFGTEPT